MNARQKSWSFLEMMKMMKIGDKITRHLELNNI
jgi:hypothetical protein